MATGTKAKSGFSRAALVAIAAACALALAGWSLWPGDPPAKPDGAPGRPDIRLRFVFPDDPALVLVDDSDEPARVISWTLSLWNMSRTPAVRIPIPPGSYEWAPARGESAAIRLFEEPRARELLKPGDHLFGSASVQCVPCRGGRSYVVNIVWGQGGWFAEVKGGGTIYVPGDLRKETLDAYFASLEKLAADGRKQSIAEPASKIATITRRVNMRAAVQNDRLYIMNVGYSACYVWGLKLGDHDAPAPPPRRVETGMNVSFPLDEVLGDAQKSAGDKAPAVVPLQVFLKGQENAEKFTMRASLELVRKGAALDVNLVNLGVFDGGW